MSPLELAPKGNLEETFRRLVGDCTGRLSVPIGEIETVYATLGFTAACADSNSAGEVVDYLHEEIRRQLATTDATRPSFAPMLRLLRDQLVMRQLADGISLEPFLPILVVIREAIQKLESPVRDLRDEAAWRNAIVAALDCVAIAPRDPSLPPSFGFEYQRQRAIARSIGRLRAAGYPCSPVDGVTKMDLDVEQRLTSDLQRMVEQLGGLPLVQVLFSVLGERFDRVHQRYHLSPNGWNRQWEPSIPFGYILNLAVRAPTTAQITLDDAKPLFKAIQERATDYVCLYDVEHNDPFTVVHAKGKEFIAEVVRALRYDAMIGFPQFRPTDARDLLLGLFDWVDDETAERAIGGTIREAATVIDFVLRRSHQADNRPRPFKVPFIASRFSMIAEPRLRRILDSLSHSKCNERFQLADDFARADFTKRPFIRVGDEYVVMSSSWCAPSAIDAIRLAVLKVTPDADREMGFAFERTVRSALGKHGVQCRWGSYREFDAAGGRTREKPEIDCLVETEDTVILFELKKRPLSRTARTNDLELLHSLASSLFESQAQLARHELNLRCHGAIDLNQDGTVYRLELRGRRIERVSLSLNDLGALQDRGLALALLRNFAGATLTHEAEQALSADEISKFRKAQQRCRELGETETRIRALTTAQEDMPFASCWFMSFGELLVRLDHVTDNASLLREIDVVRRLILGMRNPYAEYKQLRQIEPAAPENEEPDSTP